ncbi:MAG: TonB-dependent receptor [Chitinophagaceae bacterium]|nr:TonB-dependent receptor [Chitinophagaceae bacterium]MCW5927601.1 TonB-dependent receptor [Chitinophagaceae bacterium]
MKLTIALLTTVFIQVQASGIAQDVSLRGRNLPITKVIAAIEEQTDYVVFGNREVIAIIKPVSVNVREMPLLQLLTKVLKDQPVDFLIKDKTIVLFKKKESPPSSVPVMEDSVYILPPVRGVIVDAEGNPLPGASVIVKGTNTSAVTEADGSFSIEVKIGDILVVSFVGYVTKEYKLEGATASAGRSLRIALELADAKLTEVVLVGYGTRTKGAVTGAISTVKNEVFENRPLNNSFDALQGTIPGMTITRASGKPGEQRYTMQIRGYSSISSNNEVTSSGAGQPLVLIDGIPGDMSTINPNDIAEISVLKDAAASIYGARAADGVILVTTKNGKKGNRGNPVIDYTANVGLKTPSYLRKIQNTLQYAEFQDEGLRNAGIAGFPDEVFEKIRANAAPNLDQGWNYGITSYPGFYGYTNWNDAIYKNAFQQLHNVSVSGGGENNTYLVSLGYNRDDGLVRYGTNVSERYNLRLNYNFRLSSKLQVDTRTSFEHTATKEPSMLSNALTNVTRQFPYQPVFNPLGQFYGYQGYENPAQSLTEAGLRTIGLSRINSNLKLDYTVIPGLKLTGQAAIRLDYFNNNATNRTFTRYNYKGDVQDIRNVPNSASYQNQKTLYRLYQVYADYTQRIGGNHSINLTAGTSLEQTNYEGQTVTGYNFPSNDIFTLNLADRTSVAYSNFTGLRRAQALNSYFGRASYSFREKIVLDLTARADGSSKFAPAKRWSALFPSAALAYNLSDEKFISNLELFDQLKLRASWGKMGNQEIPSLGLYDYIPLINIGGVYPLGSPNAGVPGAIANPASADRTWETIENKNIGIDMQLFKSRLSFSFDYFQKTNNNMLVNISVPATYGGTPPTSNQGKLVTKGFEANLLWRDQIRDFRYSITLQLSDSKNKLVELKNSENFNEGLNFVRKGYSIYSYFGYVYEGIIQTQEELNKYKTLQNVPSNISIGDVMYKDVDGDGVLTAFGDRSKGLSGDMVYLGNLLPRYTYSGTFNLGYKQFDLNIFLQGVGKRDIQYQGNIATPNTFFWPSLAYYYGKTWTPERTDAPYPRYLPGSVGYDGIRNYNYRTSALTMQNVSYLRFKTITLGYNLPSVVLQKLRINSLRVYVSGQDLFTFSKGTLGGNFDPEDGFRNEGTYPFSKVYSLGVNVKF